jgi:hypothetical protein
MGRGLKQEACDPNLGRGGNVGWLRRYAEPGKASLTHMTARMMQLLA